MSLEKGQQLSHYRIVERIGQGGMGEVYRAEDTKLGREVALKVLPSDATGKPDRLKRFQREARAIAALNHPGIVTIHSVEEAGGIHFLTMELIDGKPLGELIPESGLGLARILELAIPLVEALSVAHERGIIHRDLKPANVMISHDGRLKILDFGLAKLHSSERTPGDSVLPTEAPTREGIAVGTLPYMSPEQLEGGTVDHRTDIFSLGTMLCEMATGVRPFSGRSPAALMSAILRDKPNIVRGRSSQVSPGVEQILSRCLAKAPEDRYPTTRDLLNELQDLRQELSSAPDPVTRSLRQRSIVVLPFTDMSPEHDQEYFCDGISEEIINALARIKGLRVTSRLSAFRYKHSDTDCRTIGEQLGVTHLLQGSVRKAGDRLRIAVQLIDAGSDNHIWTERYDRRLEDVFAIQEDIAQSTAQALQIALTAEESRALGKAPTTKVDAYDLYLRGREFFYKGTRRDHEVARRMFSRAIKIDPAFTRAYAGLADTASYMYKHFENTVDLLDEAEAASDRALELSPELPESHTSSGVVHWLKGRFEEADAEFEAAIRLDPGLFDAYYLFAIACFTRGLHEKTVRLLRQASNARPEDYQSLIIMGSVCRSLGREREARDAYEKGLALVRQTLDLHPDDARAWYLGSSALVGLGDFDTGLEWARHVERMDPDNPLVFENLAGIHAAAGDLEKGMECLERAVALGLHHRGTLENDPDLATLRSHPRFRALLEKL